MGAGIIRIQGVSGRWHDEPMKRITILCLLLAQATVAQASTMPVRGQVVGDEGLPIAGATIEARGRQFTSGPDGRFEFPADVDEPLSLHISAGGYYAMIHTFAREDIAALGGDVGPITIVAQRADRRLLLFTGDAMLARRYFEPPAGEPALMRKGSELEDGKKILEPIRPYIELADHASVNLETQLSSGTLDDRLPKSVTFYSPAEYAEVLEWAGFDYVALGNNHTWDYQGEGLASTFAALAQTGLTYSGAGFDERTARDPWLGDLDGEPYAFLSYVGWAGTFSPHQAAEGDKGGAALGGSDVFAEDLAVVPDTTTAVLQYHSGLEYSHAPAMSERTRLREAIDNGADIAIGHHAHILQGIEIYKGRLIAYSMGNFMFDQTYYTTQLGMLLYVWMDDDRLHRIEVVPMYVNGYVPTPATGAMRYAILNRVARLSQDLGTCMRPTGAHIIAGACDDPVVIDLGTATPGDRPLPLAELGVHPASAVSFGLDGYQYRLGTDILRRGDFESAGHFGIAPRGWILGDGMSLVDGEERYLEVAVPAGAARRTGMSALQRVFTPSNPSSLSGRIYSDGPAVVQFRMQRRRPGMTMNEALEQGPLRDIGGVSIDEAGWRRFSIEFDQPRITTEALRLLFDLEAEEGHDSDLLIRFDDLSWVEWTTPWLGATGQPDAADFGTFVQFRAEP
jgi:poly-gamma-glutamate capsule biosynthesis protein CapA/YwtB (metallophosphatase superfamily)